MSSPRAVSDWSGLPSVLLELICSKIRYQSDFLRFKAVCKSWRFVDKAPKLMLPLSPPLFWDLRRAKMMILNGNNRRTHKTNLPPDFPDNYSFIGLTQGWLVFRLADHLIVLLNPFSSRTLHIQLPALCRPYKFVASIDPLDANCMFLALPGCVSVGFDLVICRAGNEEWQTLNAGVYDRFVDIIFYQNYFYALLITGRVYVLVDSKLIPFAYDPSIGYSTKNLVESSGNLLLVHRIGTSAATCSFQIFKVNTDTGDLVRVTNLGDNSLILSRGFSFSTKLFPKPRSNSIIYFTRSTPHPAFRLCSFDLETEHHETIVEHLKVDPTAVWYPVM